MRIIGCDLHARQQTLAMLDTTTGEVLEVTLKHEGDNVREFYSALPRPVRVGIEATGSMQWFVNLMEELGIQCLVGNPRSRAGRRFLPSRARTARTSTRSAPIRRAAARRSQRVSCRQRLKLATGSPWVPWSTAQVRCSPSGRDPLSLEAPRCQSSV